jgi:hypothetical protein
MSLASSKIDFIGEEDNVNYSSIENLSYDNMDGEENILLFDKGDILGFIKVWKDTEMDGMEYITLNYHIIYLNTIKCINTYKGAPTNDEGPE